MCIMYLRICPCNIASCPFYNATRSSNILDGPSQSANPGNFYATHDVHSLY